MDSVQGTPPICSLRRRQLDEVRIAFRPQNQQPICHTAIGKRVFSYAGPHAWNALPPMFHTITDAKQFRKQLKRSIFRTRFCDNEMHGWTIQ